MRLYLLVGLAALAVFYAMPYDTLFQDTIYYPALGLASVVTILAAIVWYRPSHVLPWLLFAAGQLLFVAGDALFGVYEHVLGETPVPSAADALYLLGYPALAAGLWLLVRQRSSRTDWTSLIDAAMVTVALGIVAWEMLFIPYTRDDTLSLGEKLVSVAYPLGDVLLLAVAARLVFGTAVRTVSHMLIVLSLVCLLVADPLYAVFTIRGDHGSGSPADAGWILAYLFFGAAALHPSMRRTSRRRRDRAEAHAGAHRIPRCGGALRARRTRVPAGADRCRLHGSVDRARRRAPCRNRRPPRARARPRVAAASRSGDAGGRDDG